MNGNEGVLISVANLEVSTTITANMDLLPSAPVSFFLARNDITVGATGHASVQSHIQVPKGKDKVHIVLKSSTMTQRNCIFTQFCPLNLLHSLFKQGLGQRRIFPGCFVCLPTNM